MDKWLSTLVNGIAEREDRKWSKNNIWNNRGWELYKTDDRNQPMGSESQRKLRINRKKNHT